MGVAAVVLAGGSGSRVGADRNKVLLTLRGLPVLAHSVGTVCSVPGVTRLVVVVRPEGTPDFTSADDDAFCRANNVAAGSNDYVICRKNRDVQRGNANARADRSQRNLAEQMLNNPTRP